MSKLIKPQNGYVLIEPIDEDEFMAGNIIMPDLGREKPAIGIVLDTSLFFNQFTGVWCDTGISEGDTVIIPRMGSQKITIENKEYWLCKGLEVLTVLK